MAVGAVALTRGPASSAVCVCVCRQLVCEGRSKKLKVYRKAPEAPGKVENVGGVVSVDREGAAGNSIAAGLTLFCELE